MGRQDVGKTPAVIDLATPLIPRSLKTAHPLGPGKSSGSGKILTGKEDFYIIGPTQKGSSYPKDENYGGRIGRSSLC
jgi:hypothetical protein